ncbi:MAG: hypothetical protein MSA09_11460 [Lachnospiraceae bacterium]|nr:hypothetical protein [Lachnospiraceae bacterium]MDY5517610.1 hypothetical protein [Lachnospiraceae bacterium]
MKQRERSKDEIPFSEMTPAQKRSYLVDYWSKPALVVIVVAVMLVSLIHSMVSSKEMLLSVTTVDSGDDKSFTPYVEQFVSENGIPEDQYVVGDIVVGTAATGGGTGSQAGMAFYVRLQAGSEDIIIMPESVFLEYATSGYFLDLTGVVPQEWQDQLISVDQRYDEVEEVQPDPIACGIYMRDIPGMPDTPYYQDAVIAISYYPDNQDYAEAFLNSLLKK